MRQILQGVTWLLGEELDCNVFIIESNDESLLIDSGLGDRMAQRYGIYTKNFQQLENTIKEKNIQTVFLTHAHIDHVGGVMSLQSKMDLNIVALDIEAQYLRTGDSSYIEPFLKSECLPINVTKEVKEGDVLKVGNFSFKVLHTPGHTHGSTSLWDEKNQILVSGDTVFSQGSFGRTDLLSGSNEEMISSLKRLSELDTKILLPGHMAPLISTSDSTKNSIKRSYIIAQEMLLYY